MAVDVCEVMTQLTFTGPVPSVSMETRCTPLAVRPRGVITTIIALSCCRVAVSFYINVHVIITVTPPALAIRFLKYTRFI